jgi:hypothetical protein
VVQVQLQNYNGRQFLIGVSDYWPFNSHDSDEVRSLLDEVEGRLPSLVFFRIDRTQYEQVIECPYLFKFYPEMNVPCPAKDE